MSAFNTIEAEASCPSCGHEQEWTIQFKYGSCWQYEYRIGDRLRWGPNKKGSNVGGPVRVPGVTEQPCQRCSMGDIGATVYLSDNVIKRIELLLQPLQIEGYYERLQPE
jgi:hypothetical protein